MNKGLKWSLISIAIIAVVGGLWFAAFQFASGSFLDQSSDPFSDFEEQIVEESDSTNKVAIINVVGEIFSDPDGTSEGASDANIVEQIEQAQEDSDVKAVIVNLETPGGGVVASETIYKRLLRLRREADKPVVALMGDVAASGGYYIAAGADEVVAHSSTWTGSIGVIAMLPNFERAAEKLGVGVTVIKSGALKDAGSPFRPMTAEEQTLFQTLIDEAYTDFITIVAEGRSMPLDKVRQIADGRIYSGKQAHSLGLVDHIGDQGLAFRRAKALAKIDDAALVRYSSIPGLSDILGVTSQKLADYSALKQELGVSRRPGAAYLWIP